MGQRPHKMKSYQSFADWKRDQSAENQKSIRRLQRLITDAVPGLQTTVKWGQGCWTRQDVPKLFIHAEPDHVQLGFYHGASLSDPAGLLRGSGKYVRHVRVNDARAIDATAIRRLLIQAAG